MKSLNNEIIKTIVKETLNTFLDEWKNVLERVDIPLEEGIEMMKITGEKVVHSLFETLKTKLNENKNILLEQEGIKLYVQKGDNLEVKTFETLEELDEYIKKNNLKPNQYKIERE